MLNKGFLARAACRVMAAVLMVIAFANVNTVLAQSNVDGRLYGTAVAGSTVRIVNKATGFAIEHSTASGGSFSFDAVPIGDYTVTAKSPDGTTSTQDATVIAGNGVGVYFAQAEKATTLGAVKVTANHVSLVDTKSSENSFTISNKEIAKIPVGRDLTDIALLTPGSIRGANTFGAYNAGVDPTFNGSTPAENVYYLNGLDISDLRIKLDPSNIPVEFVSSFDVKTGGYSAEFGRSSGGVVNEVTKSGTNKWKFGGNAFISPDLGNSQASVVYTNPSDGSKVLWYNGDPNHRTETEYNLFASGPIIKNKLFIYGLVDWHAVHADTFNPDTSTLFEGRSGTSDPFYAGKLDWNILEGHHFEATLIRDLQTTFRSGYNYDTVVDAVGRTTGKGAYVGSETTKTGGTIQIYRYTGQFFDQLTASLLYGSIIRDGYLSPADPACPSVVLDTSEVSVNSGGTIPQGTTAGCDPFLDDNQFNIDKRKSYRADFAWSPKFLPEHLVGIHTIKFGVDQERNASITNDTRSGPNGGNGYTITYDTDGTSLENGYTVPAGQGGLYVKKDLYQNIGTTKETLQGIYFEDQIQLFDRLTAEVGFRKDKFKEFNKIKQTFLNLSGPFAPRLGLSFDVAGNGNSKVFANYGRYYYPLSTQITVRNGNGELYYSDYYKYGGSISNDKYQIPTLGAQVGDRVTTSPGRVTNPATLVSPTVQPSYQDQYSLGFESQIDGLFKTGSTKASIIGYYRNLGRTVEDTALDSGLNTYFAGRGDIADLNPDGTFANGFDYYFITNPGEPSQIALATDTANGKFCNPSNGDPNCTGPTGSITVPTALPKAKRKYYGLEFDFEHIEVGKWDVRASYTYSHLFGNYEGPVNSFLGQADVGITEDFDQPGLLDNAYGNLNADRRHNVKLFGSFNATKEWQLSANYSLVSGSPISAYSYHPAFNPATSFSDSAAQAYGAFAFFDNAGNPEPRGSVGRTPWVRDLDLGIKYTPKALSNNLVVGLDVFNVFDSGKYYSVEQTLGTSAPTKDPATGVVTPGGVNPAYGLPLFYQAPRSLRLSARYEFGL